MQDDDRGGGLHAARDIIQHETIPTCSTTNPCPASLGACDIPMGATDGVCHDGLQESEVEVGIPARAGGNAIRIVFNKLLTADTQKMLTADGGSTMVQLMEGATEKDASKYWDPTGQFDLTSDPIVTPYGPAIVIRTKASAKLSANTDYEIKLDLAQIKDRDGNGPTADRYGAIKSSYTFKTTDLRFDAVTPELDGEIAPDDYFRLDVNADLSADTSTVVVMKGGARVKVAGFLDCDEGERVYNVLPVDASGAAGEWSAGDYTFEATMKGDNGKAMQVLSGTFTATAGATTSNPIGNVTFNNASSPCE